jgi:putative hydrolase
MGKKRVQAIRECLAGRFRGRVPAPERSPAQPHREPGAAAERQQPRALTEDHLVAELLSIDRAYRYRAELDRLPRIAPRSFNPEGKAWLPILHTRRGDRHYTAVFSNTARAHEMGTTHDWVVISRDDEMAHGRWTAITAAFGNLRGRRIIRGLERQCATHYAKLEAAKTAR